MLRLLGFLFALLVLPAVSASGQAPSTQQSKAPPTVESLANTALAFIGEKYQIAFEDFLVLMCTSDRQQSLAKDSDVGPYVRHMPLAKSDLAIVVIPRTAKHGGTYCVYFDHERPLGLVAIAQDQGKPKDDDIRRAYVSLVGATAPRWEHKPRYTTGVIHADDGTEIYALKVLPPN